jgi:hypothetical protein
MNYTTLDLKVISQIQSIPASTWVSLQDMWDAMNNETTEIDTVGIDA